jgi:hypothetical protein
MHVEQECGKGGGGDVKLRTGPFFLLNYNGGAVGSRGGREKTINDKRLFRNKRSGGAESVWAHGIYY